MLYVGALSWIFMGSLTHFYFEKASDCNHIVWSLQRGLQPQRFLTCCWVELRDPSSMAFVRKYWIERGYVGVSTKRGPQSRPQYRRMLFIRNPSHFLIDVLLMAPWRPEPQPIPNIDVDDVEVSPTRRLSVTSLASDITLDLIRGVALDMCLQNFGMHFGTGQRSAALARKGFELSQHTNQIAAFISHDWRTSRFSKTVALLIAFNSIYAALAALLLNMVMCGLLWLDRLHGGWPTASASTYCVFYLVLFFLAAHSSLLLLQIYIGLSGSLVHSPWIIPRNIFLYYYYYYGLYSL